MATINKSIKDGDWLRQSFMIAHTVGIDTTPDDDDRKLRARFFTTARYKFSDTSLGGNMVINPHPQFTRTADLRVGSLYKQSAGMGRYYSEVIDDNKRMITMNFGVPQFNSLSTFFQGFYDSQLSALARTGRSNSLTYTAGRVVGFVVAISSLPLMLFSIGSAFFKWALAKPSSKFYYMKPTMPVYWNAVTAIVNDIGVKSGLISRAVGNAYATAGDSRDTLTQDDMQFINSTTPDLIDSYDSDTGDGNGINMYAVATRAQRLARRAYKEMKDYYATSSPSGDDAGAEFDKLEQAISSAINSNTSRPKKSFTQYIQDWTGANGKISPDAGSSELFGEGDGSADFNADILTEKMLTKDNPEATSWSEFLEAELDDGAQFVGFRVENEGQVQESFSNTTGPSEMAGKINSMSGQAHSTRFDLAQGNVSDGVIGKVVGATLDAAKSFVTGAADSLGLGGLAILGGNAFVDIPNHWQASTSSLPRMNYTIKLRTPYGNRYSRMVNLMIPLAMLLAAALPLSTGRHSYTSPFLCNLFDRGRAQTRLGIIDSLSITRGTTNLSFTKIGEPLGIDISFSVVDLSTIMHMPINQGFNLVDSLRMFDDETVYNDYIATLSALSLHEQIYAGERFKLAMTKFMKNKDSFFSMPHFTNFLGDLAPFRAASIIYDGIVNR